MYLVGFRNCSRVNRSSMYCCNASEPNPPLHSDTKIARPSFLMALEQFQREEKEFPRLSLLASFPVLTNHHCFMFTDIFDRI